MNVKVFDTYVNSNGKRIHFDVLLEDKKQNDYKTAIECAKKFLESIKITDARVTASECNYCHTESDADPEVVQAIKKDGFFIVKMENC